MTDTPSDPALMLIAAIIRSLTQPLAQQPSLVGLDPADLRAGLENGHRAAFGQAEAEGEDRAIVAAEAAILDLKRNLTAGLFDCEFPIGPSDPNGPTDDSDLL